MNSITGLVTEVSNNFYTVRTLLGIFRNVPSCVGSCLINDSVTLIFSNPSEHRNPVIVNKLDSGVVFDSNRFFVANKRMLTWWTQSEATHLRNNCSPDPVRVPYIFGSADSIYTYYSKAGGLHDSRARAYGLVSFKKGALSRLVVSYPRFNTDGSALEAFRVDVIDIDGSLIEYFEFESTTLAPFGNFSSDQLFLDPGNLHIWLTPSYCVDTLRMRAWSSDEQHKLSSVSDRSNSFVSVAYNFVLYPAFTVDYTGGENQSGAPPPYWPPVIIPLSESISGSIQGLIRSDLELITYWSIDPSVICNIPNSIMSSMAGTGTGWPASPDGTSWTIAVSERAMLDGTIPANAALGHGYRQAEHFTGGTIQHNTNLHSYSHKLQLNIAEISTQTGLRKWIKRFTILPSYPIVAEGLLTPFELYMSNPFGSGPGEIGHGPVIVEGRVDENSLSDKTPTDGFGYAYPIVYPGRTIESGVTIQGAEFSWPQFQYFRNSNISLFPHRSNNIIAIPPSSETSDFYSGCKNNLATFTDFGLTNELQSAPCGPGIFRDTSGNIYFSLMFPRGFLMQGVIYFRSEIIDSAIQDYVRHRPIVNWGWESKQVSLDKNGALRWERELTQWKSDAEWFGRTGSDFGFDFIVGGAAGSLLPLSDNVLWQIPIGNGKFLITIKEYHGLGSSFRPDMYLEIQDGSTGLVIQSQYLPDYFDTYVADVRRNIETGAIDPDGTLIALAGERIWYVNDCKIKSGVDSSGIPWAMIYLKHSTRDDWDGLPAYDQFYIVQAPTDGTIGPWSAVATWNPGSFDIYPSDADWGSVVIDDGVMFWNHWDGAAWKVYKKILIE